jgi:acyl-CoA thioesterase FadM
MIEKDYIYEIDVEVADLNENNILKPYGYQKLFAEVVEKHLGKLDIDIANTKKNQLAWVLVSLAFEIDNPVVGCMKLFATTWHTYRKGPYFRREIIFKNEDGIIMFQGSTFSVLFDTKKRTVYRNRELPFIIPDDSNDVTINAYPTFKTEINFIKLEERRVYNSFIDCLGHVNNCRYGEFAYDALDDEEKQDLIKLRRMDIYFVSELRVKDMFVILKGYEDNRVLVRGQNNNNISFNVVLHFK